MDAGIPAQQDRRSVTGIGGYRLFRIFGFEVKLNLTWLLLGLLITWTLAAGTFPVSYPGLAQHTYWWMGVAGAAGILFSIVFHELSHSLVARRFGLPIRGITLFIFGGMAEMEEEPASPRSEFWMALAGPVASLVLAVILYRFAHMATVADWPTPLIAVSETLAVVNLVVALFNLLPGFPLDGGRMLRAALWYWQKDLRRATRFASAVGSGFGLALMVLGVFAFVSGNFIGGMWWFLIGAFLRAAASASYRQMLVREILGDAPVREFMRHDPASASPATRIADLLDNHVYRQRQRLFPVLDDGELVGCVTTGDIAGLSRDERATKTVADLLRPCSPGNTLSPDTTAARLLSGVAQARSDTPYMVVKDNHLLGVISPQDLREYVDLRLELEPPER